MYSIFDSSVYEWGLQVIYAVQTLKNDLLTYIMIFISFLSDPLAYITFLPVVFWCVDEKKSLKAALLVLFSASLNTSLKNYLQVNRPYIGDSSLNLIPEEGYSTPSGHSQNSAAFWPYTVSLFAKNKKSKKWFSFKILLSVGLPLIIGFSRIYLGVHYPSDVLLGWTLGFLLSLGAMLFSQSIENIFVRIPRTFKILIVGSITFILNLLGPLDTSMSAAFFGLSIGYIYLSSTGGFDARKGSILQKILRSALGIFVLGLIYIGLSQVFPSEFEQNYHLFRFLRYLLVGFTASFILPKIFISMKIGFAKGENNE